MGSAMIEKLKVCMLGATAVGKTSLVARFVSSVFSDRYATTIGVRIHARRLDVDERVVDLIIWDLSGEDEFQSVQPSYLRGASGYLLVIDGTRRDTVDIAITLQERAQKTIGNAPFVAVLNKIDLATSWDLGDQQLALLHARGWRLLSTSAKTGEGVGEAFDQLTASMLERQGDAWT
jgi:small GTP-binding protein